MHKRPHGRNTLVEGDLWLGDRDREADALGIGMWVRRGGGESQAKL